uniref:Uncharacterized protein n=1 Tax=Lutzomyia longipalpis TaxID=7200 RepID=A0A1B0CTU3_LUTLO
MNLLGISKPEANKMIKGGRFAKLEIDDVEKSFYFLQTCGLAGGTAGIQNYPAILATKDVTLKNRFKVMEECLFRQITIAILQNYIVVMNKPISLLRSHKYIPSIEKIVKNLVEITNLTNVAVQEVKKLEQTGNLNDLRRYIMDDFLRKEIGATEEDLKRIWASYLRLRNKPIKSVAEVIELIRKELNFSNEKILSHAYLLYGEPENMQKILTLEKLSGTDAKEVLSLHPKILMSNYKSIVEIDRVLTENEIPDKTLVRNGKIYTLSPQTVAERIEYLKQIDEFRVLLSHPRIGRLIFYQNKAIHRLNYLKENKIFCASLNVLSGDTESFHRYVQNGVDATKGKEMIIMLSQKLKRSVKEVREYLSRHPNWCHVPLVSMSAVFDHLTNAGYTESDIFANIHILFYPLSEIIKKIEAIEQGSLDFVKEINWRSLSKTQFLALVLYTIEIEFNFSGDGIWGTTYIQGDSSTTDKSEEMQENVN